MSKELPDLLADRLEVVFCGINPGMTAATAGHHFVSGSNRFWRVLHLAGFTPEQIAPAQDRSILRYGYGLTTVVARATAAADELSPREFTAAAAAFKRKIAHHAPRFVAFLGKAAYAGISGQRELAWGKQAMGFEGAIVWILPNPSGRNRAFTLDGLVDAYRELYLEMTATSVRTEN